MNAQDVQTMLAELIAQAIYDDDSEFSDIVEDSGLFRVNTYEERGVLTTDAGLVLTFTDETEYQLTIVKSR